MLLPNSNVKKLPYQAVMRWHYLWVYLPQKAYEKVWNTSAYYRGGFSFHCSIAQFRFLCFKFWTEPHPVFQQLPHHCGYFHAFRWLGYGGSG